MRAGTTSTSALPDRDESSSPGQSVPGPNRFATLIGRSGWLLPLPVFGDASSISYLISKQKVSSNQFKEAVRTEALLDSNNIIINISPDNITKDELKIEINGKEVEIMEINKITEYARGFFMYGYLVQVLKPKDLNELELQYDRISITLHSSETGEIGKGKAFVKR